MDYMIRATAADAQIRAFAATTRGLVEEARSRHETSPVVTAGLGRLMTAGVMMGGMLKGDNDLLTLQIQCNGPVKGMTVTADAAGHVKGYAINPQVMLPPNKQGKLDVGGMCDLGVLSVIKDMGLKDPYVGQVALTTGEIAEDITYYFATSEQVPSSVGLGVLMNKDNTVRQAGGFIIQLMPFASEELMERLEKRLQELKPVTTLLEEGKNPEQLLTEILGDMDLVITEKTECSFHCNCDKDRIEKALISIGEKELKEMIAEGKPIEVNCHFCNTHYAFTIEELKDILKRAKTIR